MKGFPAGWSKQSSVLEMCLHGAPELRSACFGLLMCLAYISAGFGGEPPAIERLQPPGGQRGTTFDVKVIGKAGDGNSELISSSGHIQFTLKDSRDAGTVTIAPEASAGVHWVRFANDFGATELIPFVVGLIPELTETEPNNRLSEATAVTVSSVIANGILEKSGDVDCFAVAMKAGQTLVASLQANRILNSPMDGVLQLVNQRGTVLIQNDDDNGTDPLITFTAPTDGSWYVRTFAFPASPDSSIRFSGAPTYVYRLTLTTEAYTDFCLPRVRSRSDAESLLTLHGWNLTNTAATLPAAFPSLGIGVAPMNVPFIDMPSISETELDSERRLNAPMAVSGVVLSREGDTYTVDGVKGTQINLRIRAHEFSSPLDPILVVKDAAGMIVKESDDISGDDPDCAVTFSPAADGPLSVNVSDRFHHSGSRYFYVLQCDRTQPSVRIETAKTAFVLTSDKPLEIPLTVSRLDGFAEALDFLVDGLPEGLSVEPVRSEKEGDSSKAVTLKITGNMSGPKRMVIQVQAVTADQQWSVPVVHRLRDKTETTDLLLIAPMVAAEQK